MGHLSSYHINHEKERNTASALRSVKNAQKVPTRVRKELRRRLAISKKLTEQPNQEVEEMAGGKADNGIIQAITLEIEGGFRVTGAYIGPQTKRTETEEFVRTALKENGNNYFLCGDLNARHSSWDTRCKERGMAIHGVASETPRKYVCAAKNNSYHKVVYKKKKRGQGSKSDQPDQEKVRT